MTAEEVNGVILVAGKSGHLVSQRIAVVTRWPCCRGGDGISSSWRRVMQVSIARWYWCS